MTVILPHQMLVQKQAGRCYRRNESFALRDGSKTYRKSKLVPARAEHGSSEVIFYETFAASQEVSETFFKDRGDLFPPVTVAQGNHSECRMLQTLQVAVQSRSPFFFRCTRFVMDDFLRIFNYLIR